MVDEYHIVILKMEKNYIFGYGSLMNSESRNITVGRKDAISATIQGFQRGWNGRQTKITSLGAYEKKDAQINGVIFEVNEPELDMLDKRETGYYRKIIDNQDLIEGNLWIYLIEEPLDANMDFPIILSYSDCVISGAFEFGDEFAIDYMEMTEGWDLPILDDRKDPIYSSMSKKQVFETVKIDEFYSSKSIHIGLEK